MMPEGENPAAPGSKVGVLLIQGAGRRRVDGFVRLFSQALGRHKIAATVRGLRWSDLTGSRAPAYARPTVEPAASLQLAITNTAHLPTRRSHVAAEGHSLPGRVSGALLDGFWIVAASLWPLFYVYSAYWLHWKVAWFLGACGLALSLVGLAYLSERKDPPLANFRRSLLLALWPFVFLVAAPSWAVGLAAFVWFGRTLNRWVPSWWPQKASFDAGLPAIGRFHEGITFIVWLALILTAAFVIGFFVRRWRGAVVWPLRLTGDAAFYLGDREYREQAQLRLKEEIDQLSRGVDCLVVGGHGLSSVLAVDTIRRFGLPDGLERLVLVTVGSPLKDVLARLFPASYPEPSYLSAMIRRQHSGFSWLNVYRPSDPVGRGLGLESGHDVSTLQDDRFYRAHVSYWSDLRVLSIASEFVAKVVHESSESIVQTAEASPEPSDGTIERGFEGPAYVQRVRASKGRAWAAVAVLSIATWVFSASIEKDRALAELSDRPSGTYDGYILVRKEPFRVRDARFWTRPTFWVEYWPNPEDQSVCLPIDATVDVKCMLSSFFPEPAPDDPLPEVRSCFEMIGGERIRDNEGRFMPGPILAVQGKSGPATVADCRTDPSWRITRWLYTAIAWLLPVAVVLLLVSPCFPRRAGRDDWLPS